MNYAEIVTKHPNVSKVEELKLGLYLLDYGEVVLAISVNIPIAFALHNKWHFTDDELFGITYTEEERARCLEDTKVVKANAITSTTHKNKHEMMHILANAIKRYNIKA